MAYIFLSPSTQEFNNYLNEGNEELYMNQIADALEPYLYAMRIAFDRNNPNESTAQAIRDSNSKNYDLHLAIHSNASPSNLEGKLNGIDIYYNPVSTMGRLFAEILQNNYKEIYFFGNLI